MAEAAHGAQGGMDIRDQKETFSGFVVAGLWTSTHVAQAVALLVLAFAIGAGWWPGVAAVIAIGVGVGLFFRMSGAWWAVQIAQAVLLILGGLIVPAIAGMMH
ncbi:MAG TPA: aa3-type cytochrome c oxidase subunit IV [Caulobacterales bacterium]|nr:aa3-type cytochrome c oxidase subunit IV [Caulobacterales bacterium]